MNVALSKAGWDALTDREQKVVRYVLQFVQLGYPAIYVAGPNPGDPRWYTFHDTRIRLLDLAVIGCFAANRADLPAGYTIPLDGEGNVDRVQLRSDIVSWLTNPARTYPFVHPDNVTPSDGIDVTPQDVLDANSAPAVLRSGSLPDTWVPYDPDVHGTV